MNNGAKRNQVFILSAKERRKSSNALWVSTTLANEWTNDYAFELHCRVIKFPANAGVRCCDVWNLLPSTVIIFPHKGNSSICTATTESEVARCRRDARRRIKLVDFSWEIFQPFEAAQRSHICYNVCGWKFFSYNNLPSGLSVAEMVSASAENHLLLFLTKIDVC